MEMLWPMGVFLVFSSLNVKIVFSGQDFHREISSIENNAILKEKPHFKGGFNSFPPNFKWGFATASYQIEGGWKDDGKGENIWDNFTHAHPTPVFDNSTGDIACDSYHKYKEDVQLLKNSGAKVYRFSLSWSRILPFGSVSAQHGVNNRGLNYYKDLIDELVTHEIEPIVTLYHWDLPQVLQNYGGFLNEELIIQKFAAYARLVFSYLGDRVKTWITFNEPWSICWNGYGTGKEAPGIKQPGTAPYTCAHTLLKAHAVAYRIYQMEFQKMQKGRIGLALDCNSYHVGGTGKEFKAAAERAREFKHGWFLSPLIYGKYPDVMREFVDAKSQEEGRNESRLPIFEAEWVPWIQGTLDFVGVNHYTIQLVSPKPNNTGQGWFSDQDIFAYSDPKWPSSGSDWLKVVPWGFRLVLNWIKDTYGNPEVIVTENGFSDNDLVGLNDVARKIYHRLYIQELLKAIEEGCNVTGYLAWSLLDNFEWERGYSERFGVHWVNFTNPARPRVPKDSVKFLKKVFTQNGYASNVNQAKPYE